jgi:hypothetical protein
MQIGQILKDSLKYPLSDWKKFLILGIIIIFSSISGTAVLLGTTNTFSIYILVLVGIMIGFLVNGYLFKILKFSLIGKIRLPEFKDWNDLFINGIKLNIIGIFYIIPAILIVLVFNAGSFVSILGSTGTVQFSVSSIISNVGVQAIKYVGDGTWAIIVILYMAVIYPISLIAIANMAENDNRLSAAFKFREIFNKIAKIGWGRLVEWYIVIGIVYYVINMVMGLIVLLIFSFHTSVIGTVIFSLIVTPYLSMYFYRALALVYTTK